MQRGPRLSLRLFGEFALTVNGDPQAEIPISSRKGRALIAYLALHPDQRASREHLANLLWGNRHDVQARQDLRQCLASLRRDLAAQAPELLVADNTSVGIKIDHLAIDAVELAALTTSSETPNLARAVVLCRGELLSEVSLEEPFDDWLSVTRHRFDEIASDVFESCAKHAYALGDGKQASDAVERLIAIDPLREDWHRLAIQIYARYRSREAALSHATRVSALLKRELGTDPELATLALVKDIRRGAITVAASDLDCKTPDAVDDGGADVVDIARSDSTADVGATGSEQLSGLAIFLGRLSKHVRGNWRRVGVASSLIIALVMTSSLWLLGTAQVGEQTSATSAPASHVGTGTYAVRQAGSSSSASLSKPESSIIVLPFTVNGDQNGLNESMANAITDDLVNVLTQNSELQVVSRRAMTDEMRSADLAALSTRFGVRYVVDGGVRTEGSHLRINVALVDATSGLQVWSDQFTHDNGQVAKGETVARLARGLQFGMTLAQSRHEREDSAEQQIFNGQAALFRGSSLEQTEEEVSLFEQALSREPDSVAAQLGLAMTLIRATLNSLADDPQQNLDRAEVLINRVLQREPISYRAQYWKGLLHKARGDLGGAHAQYRSALQALNRTLELNPSAAYVHAQIGAVLVKLGRPSEGFDEIQYAIRVNPKDPSIGFFYLFAGEAELEMHHDLEAIEWLMRAIARMPRNPTAYKLLSASYALAGDRENRQKSSARFRQFSSGAAYHRLVNSLTADVIHHPAGSRSRISEGLRLAFTP